METEITKKIRSAIENKLIELDAFVDKELPEYIMVMVANKKSKEQMDDDLALFLGENVGKFTTWLLEILHVEKQGNNKNSSKCVKIDTNVNNPSYEDDILALDAQEQETDEFLQKELEEEAPQKKAETVIKENCLKRDNKNVTISSESDKDVGRVTAKEVFQKQSDTVVKATSATKSMQLKPRSSSFSAKLPRLEDINDAAEYDPQNPSLNVKSVAKKVLPPERKFSVPPSHQANKLMLLKAVDEANKSVLSKQKLEEVYNPTPIKVLASSANHQNRSKTICSEYRPSPIIKSLKRDDKEEEYIPQPFAAWHVKEPSPPLLLDADEDLYLDDYVPETIGRKVVYNSENTPSLFKSTKDGSNGDIEVHARPVSPHFVVTLDGYDSRSRKRSSSSMSLNETSDKEDIENMGSLQISEVCEEEEEPQTKKLKTLERCHFWPSCKNGDNCEFHHPTTKCKTFPNCKFGGKCFYVHPKCKFDVLCTRKDCPYTHTCKKDFPLSKGPPMPLRSPYPVKFVPIPPPYNTSSPKCKFFPHCTAFKCPYFHPKPCRYGNDCQSASCTYIHTGFPAPNQLKWKAE